MKNPFIIHSGDSGLFCKLTSVLLLLLVAGTAQAQYFSATTLSKEDPFPFICAAGNEPIENHFGSVGTAEVRYAGIHEGDALFNILYTNSAGARFSVKVLDNEGHQLFQGVYTDRKFDKKFKVTDAQNYGKLLFIIRNFQDNSVQRFEIDSVDSVAEDVEVKEIK